MSLAHLLNRHFTVKRRTTQVFDSAVISLLPAAADRTPTESYMVEVEVTWDGSGPVGSVIVAGTSGGSGDSQTLDLSGVLTEAGTVRVTTTMRFDANTAITLAGLTWLSMPTCVGRAVRSDGSPLKLLYTLQSAWPGRIDRKHGSWGLPRSGSVQLESPYVFLHRSDSYVPREGDELTDNRLGRVWRIESVPQFDDYTEYHHWECPVQPQEF